MRCRLASQAMFPVQIGGIKPSKNVGKSVEFGNRVGRIRNDCDLGI